MSKLNFVYAKNKRANFTCLIFGNIRPDIFFINDYNCKLRVEFPI